MKIELQKKLKIDWQIDKIIGASHFQCKHECVKFFWSVSILPIESLMMIFCACSIIWRRQQATDGGSFRRFTFRGKWFFVRSIFDPNHGGGAARGRLKSGWNKYLRNLWCGVRVSTSGDKPRQLPRLHNSHQRLPPWRHYSYLLQENNYFIL